MRTIGIFMFVCLNTKVDEKAYALIKKKLMPVNKC